jgi:LmbE family N-acetylglucosaminyl deacetylase
MNERVLCVAAHPDDEALGCGGTLARHVLDGDEVDIIFCADGETSRGMKALPNRNFMAHEAAKVLGAKIPTYLDYVDQRLDQASLLELTQHIEDRARIIRPTIVYMHHLGDLNRDHQLVAQATLTAFRPLPFSSVRAIYAFEVPSSTEWGTGFWSNHYVDVSKTWNVKILALKQYESEMREMPHPRSLGGVFALARWRGAQAGISHAEAFMTMRTIR